MIAKLFRFYVLSSTHVGLAVLSLLAIVHLQYDLSWQYPLFIFVFCATVVTYNFIRYFEKLNLNEQKNEYEKCLTLISKIFGKKGWKISWEEIVSIKSFSTSQGSKVHYFATKDSENFLIPQRIENFERFLTIISKKTKLKIKVISYLSPLWTYKLLTFFSVLMIVWEIVAFKYQILSMLNL